jgi:hypothetical protein
MMTNPLMAFLHKIAERSPRLKMFVPAIPVLFAAYEAYRLIQRRRAANLAAASPA